MTARLVVLGSLIGALIANGASVSIAQDSAATITALRQIDTRVIDADPAAQKSAREAVRVDVRNRLRAANERETAEWRKLKSRSDWEQFRDARINKLRESLGVSLAPLDQLEVNVTRELTGPGCRIRNLHFTSRSGFLVTANLYLPAEPVDAMPGILICHSHHAPKHQGELQTMGVTWARSGAAVLVMDQFGHGERRLHKFDRADAWPGSFKPERQDYYFRFNSAIQLQLAGQSLMGVMVADLMTGVDVLLEQQGIDSQRIVLLGAVAGGGDPAGVTAALDPRITCAVPFNFGGYEPEDVFPLPENAEETFDFAGSGSWESTRNLANSARDGFMPWVIVGSIAPRHLIYAHEFRWDEPRDPVWRRLKQVYAWYQADDRLSSVVGKGTVKGRPPEASHCTNIGALHRSQIYPALERWFGMPIPTEPEFERFTAEQLRCLPETIDRGAVVAQALGNMLTRRPELPVAKSSTDEQLRQQLGDVAPSADAKASSLGAETNQTLSVERVRLDVPGQDVLIPLALVVIRQPTAKTAQRVIVGIAQKGKRAFLEHRADVIAELIDNGAVVVLADLRGTGESEPEGESRGRTGGATSRAASELMLGRSTLGLRIGDLRTILHYLRQRADLNGHDFALWGEGFAPANDARSDGAAPLDAEKLPHLAEPMGATVVSLTSVLEKPWVKKAVAVGAVGPVHTSPHVYVPYDCVFFRRRPIAWEEVPKVPPTPNPTASPFRHVLNLDQRDGLNRPDDYRQQPVKAEEIVAWLMSTS
ncbi:MAG: acetylxylan esterase [Planctomycetaceae bacterium]|nr:acetylxylan esterase [Planctomycetaceae bacterium]